MGVERYRLLAGQHQERNEKGQLVTYQANPREKKFPIIKSKNDLARMFGESKFLPLDRAPTAKPEEESEGVVVKDVVKRDDGRNEDRTPAPLEGVKAQAMTTEDAEPSPLDDIESTLGENVTSDFPNAEAASVIVLRKGAKFYVAAKEEPDDKLNSKALKQTEVKSFIESL